MASDLSNGHATFAEDRNGQPAERDALLNGRSRPTLYQSISRHSGREYFPPDNADLEAAKAGRGTMSPNVYTTISVLLLGVFISQTDISFVMATYGQISSEFGDFESGSWLLTAYILAQCVAQPLYGKLGDIYGRKYCLQVSYVLFAVGTVVAGMGSTIRQVIVGRAIQGTGGAGMLSLVSIIITDLVAVHEVARLRSYVNLLQTTGRSCGGVIGGFLTEKLGWRWSALHLICELTTQTSAYLCIRAFLIQVPPTLLAIILVQWKLPRSEGTDQAEESNWQKLKRVDFLGAVLLCFTIFAFCFVQSSGGQEYAWNSPIIISFIASGVVSFIFFLGSAKSHPEPIFPLHLMKHYDVITNYLITFLSIIVQFSLMISIPIYFQAISKASTTEAGFYLIPGFLGNALGALFCGHYIRRTGRYKRPTALAPVFQILSMVLCLTLLQGSSSPWQSLAILPGGLAHGTVSSSTFVGLAAGVPSEHVSVATSGMYLFTNIGSVVGTSVGSTIFQMALRPLLKSALAGYDDKDKIIRQILDSIDNVQDLPEETRDVVLPAYVQSLHSVNLLGLGCSVLSLVIGAISREIKILEDPQQQ